MTDAPTTETELTGPYKVVTEVEAHACPTCHQDAPGHMVVGPDGIGLGITYFGDDGKEEAEDLAASLNDAFYAGHKAAYDENPPIRQEDIR